jgi:hypothetical protein
MIKGAPSKLANTPIKPTLGKQEAKTPLQQDNPKNTKQETLNAAQLDVLSKFKSTHHLNGTATPPRSPLALDNLTSGEIKSHFSNARHRMHKKDE